MLITRRDTDPRPPYAPEGAPAPDRSEAELGGEGWFACASCGAFVTERRAAIRVNGARQHSFMNPAGLIFRVSCFSEAPGVCAVGDESLYFTWFSGFAWRVATCRQCLDHLGWTYRNAESRFVALIADRIVERCSPDGPSSPG